MIERFIRANIGSLNYHLTMGFLETKGIYPTEDEAIVITNFLKENYKDLTKGNNVMLTSLKGSLRPEIYQATTNILMSIKNQYF